MDHLTIEIAGRPIGPTHPPYVIAELSANHLGTLERPRSLVTAAAEAGADAVKLQHLRPDGITVDSALPEFIVSGGTLWDGRTLHELYAEAATPWEWTADLQSLAASLGVALFSSPFDLEAVDFLDSLGVPAFKIASFELVDLPLIRHAASKGKPLVLSTGMASVSEIDRAVEAARKSGAPGVLLLRCNSAYPAPPKEMDLRAIPVMSQVWNAPVGLSDHSPSNTAAVVSVALGACAIEKHLTLKRSDGGPDAAFSLEPDELRALVEAVREAHHALGAVRFGPSAAEEASTRFRRSLRACRDIAAGDVISGDNVRSVRPAGGLAPDLLDQIVGMRATRALQSGQAITWDDLAVRT